MVRWDVCSVYTGSGCMDGPGAYEGRFLWVISEDGMR